MASPRRQGHNNRHPPPQASLFGVEGEKKVRMSLQMPGTRFQRWAADIQA